MASLYDSLDDAMRAKLRAEFASKVSAGTKMPFVVPYTLFGAFILPTLWLSFSQKHHPWLYGTRWLLAVFVIAFNIHVAASTSSGNIAMSYATGLFAGWGIIYNLNLIIWTRPQATAARIIKRIDATWQGDMKIETRPVQSALNGHQTNALRQRAVEQPHTNGKADFGKEQLETEFVWQPYPHDAPWAVRFNWVLDLTTSFRGCGWNWAISSVPQPKAPAHVQAITPVDMASWPVESRAGYTRCTSIIDFLRTRIQNLTLMYLIIDFLAITMAQDPYFVLGPDNHLETPPHLSSLPPVVLLWLRQVMSLTAFIAAISGMMTANALLQYHLVPYVIPSRDQLWHYPSIFGGFSAVLDRGLAGWWGAWWHQTFRAQFLAPATYLLREGYLREGEVWSSVLTLAITFGQSGLLHAFGSWTSIPDTKPWRTPAFFALQAVGIIAQRVLTLLAKPYLDAKFTPGSRSRAICCRVGNFLFASLWVQSACHLFCDDVASTGLWLCDPIPFSPLRMLGFGRPGDRWWRWDRGHFPGWYTGARWWESGIAF